MTTRMVPICVCTALLLVLAGVAAAGPNEGGTLILHANPTLAFTSDIANYCGMAGLDSCSNAVTSVAWEPGKKIVFHAIAAFPPGSSPRLKGLSFGISYDPAKFVLAARGSCADFELPDGTWPASGTGTAQTWTTATQTGLLTECYWFAGYAYSEQTPDSTSVELIPHPLHGGTLVDDSFPAEVDTIAGYGRLGFGVGGQDPCPSLVADGPIGDDGVVPDGDGLGEPSVPELPAQDIGQIYVWIDGNPILPNPGVPYVVEAIGDSVVAINGYVAETRTLQLHKHYDATPMDQLCKRVDQTVINAREAGASSQDIAEAVAAVLRAAPDLVRTVERDPQGTTLVVTYSNDVEERFAFGPPPRPAPPLLDRARSIGDFLEHGGTIVVASGGSGWLYVPAVKRSAFVAELGAARSRSFRESGWNGTVMPPFIARSINEPATLRRVADPR